MYPRRRALVTAAKHAIFSASYRPSRPVCADANGGCGSDCRRHNHAGMLRGLSCHGTSQSLPELRYNEIILKVASMHPLVQWHALKRSVSVAPTFPLRDLDMGKATHSKILAWKAAALVGGLGLGMLFYPVNAAATSGGDTVQRAPSTCRVGSAGFRRLEDVPGSHATQCRRFPPRGGSFGSWKLCARRQ